MSHPLLELEHVSRVYGEEVEVYALRDVSLQILPGDFMSIVGPSGSGKSTMLGLLGVLDLPTSGTIRIAGQDVVRVIDLEHKGKVNEVPVETGLTEGSYIEIKKGLKGNETVIVQVDQPQ